VVAGTSASPAARAQQLAGPEFVAQPVDGEPVIGRLTVIEKPWQITLRGPAGRTFDGAELVWLRRKDRTAPAGPSGSQVLLGNGDRVRAIVRRISEDTLHANSELLGDVSIPLERVLAVVLNPPGDAAEREQYCRRLIQARSKEDVVVLSNGDQSSGTIAGVDDKLVRLDTAGGAVEMQRSSVRAIAMSAELTAFPKLAELYAAVVLADGSELAMLDGRLDGAKFRGRAACGQDVSIPLEQIVALDFRNGRLQYLSDLEPIEYRHTPYLEVEYPYERDRTVLGNALSLRGEVHRKGLGMHSRSEITYRISEEHVRFEAVAGIDDETAGRGSAVFRVLLDGKEAWESPVLTGRSAPQPLSVALDGASRLTLVVDFADLGDVQDHADWADARLVLASRPSP
jgi:hypothetical protein